MTTYTKSKCKVMFAQCSGNSVISRSFTVCIGAYQYHKSWFFLISLLRCSAFFSFFSARVSSNDSPRFHPRFTRFLPLLSHLPLVIISDHTESRSRNRTNDRRIAPKVAAVAWHFFPKSCIECILYESFVCFCSVFLT